MGYSLQAFICRQDAAGLLTTYFDKAIKIDLEQDLCLIPMTEDLFDQINKNQISISFDKFKYLTENIEKEVLSKIANNKFAYVEADYFGGKGGQVAVTWNEGKREMFLGYGLNKINHVLKYFNVKTVHGKDEFEELGLGRHRMTSDWIDRAR